MTMPADLPWLYVFSPRAHPKGARGQAPPSALAMSSDTVERPSWQKASRYYKALLLPPAPNRTLAAALERPESTVLPEAPCRCDSQLLAQGSDAHASQTAAQVHYLVPERAPEHRRGHVTAPRSDASSSAFVPCRTLRCRLSPTCRVRRGCIACESVVLLALGSSRLARVGFTASKPNRTTKAAMAYSQGHSLNATN